MKNKDFRILIDMDDTITNFLEEVIIEYNRIYGTNHSINEITEWVIPSSFEYGLFSNGSLFKNLISEFKI